MREKFFKIEISENISQKFHGHWYSGVRRIFSWVGLVQGHRWPFVFGVRCLWRHNLKSFTCFQTNVLAKFVDIICTFFYIHTPYFMCHCTEYKLWALQVRLSGKKQHQRYDTAVHNCKNIRLRVKTGEWNTLIPTSVAEQSHCSLHVKELKVTTTELERQVGDSIERLLNNC